MLASVRLDAISLGFFSGLYREEVLVSLDWQKKQDLSPADPYRCVSLSCCLSLVIKAACRGVITSAQEDCPSAFEQALHHSPCYGKVWRD